MTAKSLRAGMTRSEVADRVRRAIASAARSLPSDNSINGWEDAHSFLEGALGHAASVINAPVSARKVIALRALTIAEDPRYSSSLAVGLRVLALFPPEKPETLLGVGDVAVKLKMSRSTVHRYLTTLVVLGQLEQPEHGGRKYRRLQIEASLRVEG